jgi:DNA modification methylase
VRQGLLDRSVEGEPLRVGILDRLARDPGARALQLKEKSIDLIITSPPYLNAIDYLRCSKFSLVWMGYSISALRDLRSVCVGTEVGQSPTDRSAITNSILEKFDFRPNLVSRQSAIGVGPLGWTDLN